MSILKLLNLPICINCQKYRQLYTNMECAGLGYRWYGDGRCKVVPFHASMRKPTDHCEMFMKRTESRTFQCYEVWGFEKRELKELVKEELEREHDRPD